ncbi:MAG: GntR family transcriptional regulator [Gammaproteobacteria bacterium]|nr:GntR family transcriptional regulator [Gammaproteobacteria bacterium]MDE0285426.1 GntR family transcriptional regulator [Gammaproteobacteria bacterium]MDE0513108.1 GntR family transcriptional regulator [Gammaproteobacteria bacterium]
MSLKKIPQKQSLRDEAYASLRKALFQGVFKPNQKITEYEIADALGVSRTPVREALNLFRSQGILRQERGGSYVFTLPSLKQIEEIFEIRWVLEPLAAKKVIGNCTETDIDRLEAIVNKEGEALDIKDSSGFFQLNMEFRTTLFNLCGNENLAKIINSFMDYIYFIGMLTLKKKPVRELVIQIHTRIIQALRKNDETTLVAVINEHLDQALDAIRKELTA